MSKTALGRRLDSLMRKSPDAQASASPVQPIGRGLGKLLNGGDDGTTTQGQPNTRASWAAEFANVPAWYFFAADILLLAAAAGMVWWSSAALATRVLLAAFAVLMGTVLAVIPILRSSQVAPAPEPHPDAWLLAREGAGAEERILIFQTAPFFVGEVQRGVQGRVTVRPLPIDGRAELPPDQMAKLTQEAARAFHLISQRRGKELRASLLQS